MGRAFLCILFVCAILCTRPLFADGDELPRFLNEIRQDRYQLLVEQLSGARPLPSGVLLEDRYRRESMQAAHDYFRNTLKDAGYDRVVEESFFFPLRAMNGKNFSVEIKGRTHPNEVIIVGAHYDTTGPKKPGADDNASGVAAVIVAAEAILASKIQPERTIRFVLFDTEEFINWKILPVGSSIHLNSALKRGEKVELFINLDMISYSPTGAKHVYFDAGKYESIRSLLNRANDKAGLGFKIESWGTYQSDQKTGWKFGIPSLSIFENPRDKFGNELPYYPHYHTKQDTSDRLNFEYATEVTRLVSALAHEASRARIWSGGIASKPAPSSIEGRIERRSRNLITKKGIADRSLELRPRPKVR